ncbi:hypothetical protein [Alloactinosynnema sp. L-07]|nr:hypothetical protein [Alloactinosynnema sp. L-07]CRK57235.1 hypothetical protein [Alloactinosynnema sp. L-07]
MARPSAVRLGRLEGDDFGHREHDDCVACSRHPKSSPRPSSVPRVLT